MCRTYFLYVKITAMTQSDKERDLDNPSRQTDQPYNDATRQSQNENDGDDLQSDDDNLDDGSGSTERPTR